MKQVKTKTVKNRKVLRIVFSILIIIFGIFLMFYPWISNWFYEHAVDSVAETYTESISNADKENYSKIYEAAEEYNRKLLTYRVKLTDPFTEELTENEESYESLLCTDETGIMCFVEIPKISVYLPVYHGTAEETLLKGIGHIEGSSLPIGGDSTHAVLSGHTGLSSKKMFTDLTAMENGDLFFIHVLGETHAYRMINVEVIEPEDTRRLTIQEGRDLVTLLTCTPYGVNDHRLIVTGERTDYSEETLEEAMAEENETESPQLIAWKKAIRISGVCMLAMLVIFICIRIRQRKKVDYGGKSV